MLLRLQQVAQIFKDDDVPEMLALILERSDGYFNIQFAILTLDLHLAGTVEALGSEVTGLSVDDSVFGMGNSDADLMFIGEAPGAEEDRQGKPFVGRAGKLLDELLAEIGMERRRDAFGWAV